jgi:hypothetical protein
MTLATHGVVGSLVAQSLAWNPFLAIPIAFLSHFVLDAIPHWDYQLHSVSGDYNDSMTWKFSYGVSFISDCLKVGIDFIIGVGLSLVAFKILGQELSWVGWLGLLVAVSPDFFHFIYSHFPNKAINLLQRFHKFFHSKRRIEGSPVFGISLQGLLIFGFVVVFSFIL